MQGKFFAVNLFGNGEAVIVLHGFGCNKEYFTPLAKVLAERYRVVVPDLPGFGKSAELDKPYTLSDYGNFVLSLAEKLGIERACVIGHSFGGRIALWLASNTQFVSKLILIDSAGIKPRFSLKKALKKMQFAKIKDKIGETERQSYGSSDYRSLSPVAKRSFSLIVAEDQTADLSKIGCETLIVWGEKDKETPPYMARILHAGIRGSRLFTVENAGHFSYLDAPASVRDACVSFLDGRCRSWR